MREGEAMMGCSGIVSSDGGLQNGLQNTLMQVGGGCPTLSPWTGIGAHRLRPPEQQQDDAPSKNNQQVMHITPQTHILG